MGKGDFCTTLPEGRKCRGKKLLMQLVGGGFVEQAEHDFRGAKKKMSNAERERRELPAVVQKQTYSEKMKEKGSVLPYSQGRTSIV